jgi:hypothetical protein
MRLAAFMSCRYIRVISNDSPPPPESLPDSRYESPKSKNMHKLVELHDTVGSVGLEVIVRSCSTLHFIMMVTQYSIVSLLIVF